MNRQWVRVCAALLIACTMVFMAFAARAEVGFPTQASAMALMETESGCFLAEENGDLIERMNEQAYPIVVPVPSDGGSNGFAMERMKGQMERALGVDILFN